MMFHTRLTGMQTFLVIWAGQLVSLTGTSMTRFALLTWAYKQTGEATTLAMLGFFSFILHVLISPVAGVLVDRWDRRTVMIFSDLASGLMTVGMFVLFASGELEIWHLYIAEALTGAFEAFQVPAYTAGTSLLVPKEQYGRINGMRSLARSISEVGAPFLAGGVLFLVGLRGIFLIDIVTFLFAITTLMFVRIPNPAQGEHSAGEQRNIWKEMRFGFQYIYQRRGLLYLLMIFTGINLIATLTYYGVFNAMVLARSGGSEIALASVQGALGIGGVIGGILISVWGVPRRKIHGAFGFTAVSFIMGDFLIGTGQTTFQIMVGAFMAAIFIPGIVASERTIWQSKVDPAVQGRVFSVYGMLRVGSMPIGFLLAGPLADRLFEPAMMPGGSLADVLGWLVGAGPGAGMGLMFVCTSVLGLMVSLTGYVIPAVRNVERDLPDFDQMPEPQKYNDIKVHEEIEGYPMPS